MLFLPGCILAAIHMPLLVPLLLSTHRMVAAISPLHSLHMVPRSTHPLGLTTLLH